MRVSIFDRLAKSNLDWENVKSKVNLFLKEINGSNSYWFVHEGFQNYPEKHGFTNIIEALITILEMTDDNKENFLNFMDYLLNYDYYLVRKYGYSLESTSATIYMDSFTYFMDKLNYASTKIDGHILIHLKDGAVEKVVNIMDSFGDLKIAWKLIDFRGHSISTDDKKAIIRELYTFLEPYKKRNSKDRESILYKKIEKASRIMNYFRHDRTGTAVDEIEENPDKYLNLSFDLFLEIMLLINNDEILQKENTIINKIRG